MGYHVAEGLAPALEVGHSQGTVRNAPIGIRHVVLVAVNVEQSRVIAKIVTELSVRAEPGIAKVPGIQTVVEGLDDAMAMLPRIGHAPKVGDFVGEGLCLGGGRAAN